MDEAEDNPAEADQVTRAAQRQITNLGSREGWQRWKHRARLRRTGEHGALERVGCIRSAGCALNAAERLLIDVGYCAITTSRQTALHAPPS